MQFSVGRRPNKLYFLVAFRQEAIQARGLTLQKVLIHKVFCIPFHLLTNLKTFAGLLPSFHFTSTAKPKLKPITSSLPGHLPSGA